MTSALLELFIDGEWVSAGQRETLPVLNPATGQVVSRVPVATPADIDRALDAARRAFPAWRDTPALERARVLQRIGQALRVEAAGLARIITFEQGKRLAEAEQEIHNCADTLEWMAEEGKRMYGRIVPSRQPGLDAYVRLEPIGPVAAFSPWNFPAVLSMRKVATALAAGCPIIIKPAEETPGIMLALAKICEREGLPSGVLQVLYGVPAEISERLIDSDVIRKVSFTGSVAVGRLLAERCARALKKVTLELGGHSPVIVMDDVDVDAVVRQTVLAKFRNAGQLCLCPTRYFVHSKIHERFVAALARAAGALKVAPGWEPDCDMGPLANARRLQAMQAFCDDARQRGARIVTGGDEAANGQGYFFPPTVITDLPADAQAMVQEVFGPLALVNPFDDVACAIEAANATEYGLAAYAFTHRLDVCAQLEEGLASGNVSINTYAISPPELPFSGIKSSGLGHEMGHEGLLDHFLAKAVLKKTR